MLIPDQPPLKPPLLLQVSAKVVKGSIVKDSSAALMLPAHGLPRPGLPRPPPASPTLTHPHPHRSTDQLFRGS